MVLFDTDYRGDWCWPSFEDNKIKFSHVGYLERNEYYELEPEDVEEAREVLLEEVLHGEF